MNKLIVITLFSAFTFFANAHAVRVRVASCPSNSEGRAPMGFLAHDAFGWKIGLGPFSRAFVSHGDSDLIYCIYDKKSFAKLPMPAAFDQNTCSFDRDSPEVVRDCTEKDPQECVIYCEKK